MISVDKHKKHIYEYRGVDAAVIGARCKCVSIEELKDLGDYNFFDLSMYCIIIDEVVVLWDLTKNQANYTNNVTYEKKGVVKPTIDAFNMLPYGGC